MKVEIPARIEYKCDICDTLLEFNKNWELDAHATFKFKAHKTNSVPQTDTAEYCDSCWKKVCNALGELSNKVRSLNTNG